MLLCSFITSAVDVECCVVVMLVMAECGCGDHFHLMYMYHLSDGDCCSCYASYG